MLDTPLGASGGDTVDQTATLDHAAKVFEGLLFPESGEGQDTAKTPPADDKAGATDDTPPPQGDAEPGPTHRGDEPPAEPQPTDAPKFKWVVDGEEVELTEDEARLGYLRQRDYTKKTQTAAEIKKQAEAELTSAREQRASYLARLEAAKQSMDALVPKEPDWASLRSQGVSDADISAAVANYQAFARNRATIVAEQERVAKEALADAEHQHTEYLAQQEEALLNAVPEWRDRQTGKAELDRLASWLRSKGFTDDQLASVNDHRLILSLYNGMKWEELQKTKP